MDKLEPDEGLAILILFFLEFLYEKHALLQSKIGSRQRKSIFGAKGSYVLNSGRNLHYLWFKCEKASFGQDFWKKKKRRSVFQNSHVLLQASPLFLWCPCELKAHLGEIPSLVGFRLDKEVWKCCFIVSCQDPAAGMKISSPPPSHARSWWKPPLSSPDSPNSSTGAHRRSQVLNPLLSTELISAGLLGLNLFYIACTPTNQPCKGAQKTPSSW